MGVRLEVVEEALLLQVLDDALRDPVSIEPGQPAEARQVVPVLVERRDDRQAERLAELVVLRAGAGRDVDDARALVLADLVPGDDAVLVARPAVIAAAAGECGLDGVELVERTVVAPADQISASALLEHLERAAQRRLERPLAEPEDVLALAHLDVRQRPAQRPRPRWR